MKQEMKLFFLFVLTMLIASCSQDEEYYSCDNEVDQWVKSNIDDVQQMTRSQVLKFDDSVMKASYRAFKPEQKIAFWKEKLAEVKQLNWSSEELAHISLVEQFIETHPQCFQKTVSDEDKDEMEIFFHKWTKFAVNTLGWDRKTIVAIVVSGRRVLDTDGSIDNSVDYRKSPLKVSAKNEKDNRPDCYCKDNWINICLTGGGCEKTDKCKYVNSGCGFLLLYECEGVCADDVIL